MKIFIDNEVYAALRERADNQILDPEYWPSWDTGDRWFEIEVSQEVRDKLGDCPNDFLREFLGLPVTPS